MSKICYGPCDLCGELYASVAPLGDLMVCRVCDSENWQRVSDAQKDAWLKGELDDTKVWNLPNHSQR